MWLGRPRWEWWRRCGWVDAVVLLRKRGQAGGVRVEVWWVGVGRVVWGAEETVVLVSMGGQV